MTGNQPTQLYRHFDAQGRLLYVGISLSTIARLAQHRNSSDWYSQISRVEIQKFDTRSEAEGAEWEAIQKEKPIHNIVGNKATSRFSRFERGRRPFYYKPLWPICHCLLNEKPDLDEIPIDEIEYWHEIEETLTDEQIVHGVATIKGIFAKAFCDHCGCDYKIHEAETWSIIPIQSSFDDEYGLLKKWPYLPNSVFFPKDNFFRAFLKTADADSQYTNDEFYSWDEWRELWLHGPKTTGG